MIDESSDYGKRIELEDDSGRLLMEVNEFTEGDAILIESGDKMLYTEKGEFQIASITDDDTLTVTRTIWEGTDYVPFWKHTTDYESTAVVSYK